MIKKRNNTLWARSRNSKRSAAMRRRVGGRDRDREGESDDEKNPWFSSRKRNGRTKDGENCNYDSQDINDVNKPLVSIMTRLWARRCRVQIPTRARHFSPKRPVRLCGPPSFLLNGHRGSFPVTKKPGREDNSSTSRAKIKNGWRCNSFFPTFLRGVHREKLYLYTHLLIYPLPSELARSTWKI
jgi:hypothetical protein